MCWCGVINMKIDNYITHLQLRQKGLQKKYMQLMKISDKAVSKWQKEPNFDEIINTRIEMESIDEKLDFLIKLRKEMINIENSRVQKTSKRR